jgi:hypothetical protein
MLNSTMVASFVVQIHRGFFLIKNFIVYIFLNGFCIIENNFFVMQTFRKIFFIFLHQLEGIDQII